MPASTRSSRPVRIASNKLLSMRFWSATSLSGRDGHRRLSLLDAAPDLAHLLTDLTFISPMNVLISVDIEGIAGVFHPEQTRAGNGEYERARRWMTLEANAAIQGAFAGGATQVWVNDSHGGFRNLLPDLLDTRAQVVLGKPRTLGMMAGLEYGAALVFMIGYHAMSQSRGILAHTINSFAFARVLLNGVETGEAGLYGALAAQYGAQVALLSGDDVFAEETATAIPGRQLRRYQERDRSNERSDTDAGKRVHGDRARGARGR